MGTMNRPTTVLGRTSTLSLTKRSIRKGASKAKDQTPVVLNPHRGEDNTGKETTRSVTWKADNVTATSTDNRKSELAIEYDNRVSETDSFEDNRVSETDSFEDNRVSETDS